MIPFSRIYFYAAIGFALIAGFAWYRAYLIGIGKAQCEANIQRAIMQQQAVAEQDAAVYQAQEDKTRIEYRTRIKEVTKYVPINHACDLPASTIRMLNDAIRTGQ